MSMRSLTRCRQAPSMTPVAMGPPAADAAGETGAGGSAADGAGDLGRFAVQDLMRSFVYPPLGSDVTVAVQAAGGLVEVFEDVDEVHDDRHVDAPVGGFCADPVDLVVVAIHE